MRKDQYGMDGDRIILKGLGAVGWIEVRYKDPIHLRGERGELKIRYDADRGNGTLIYHLRSPRSGQK